jgi:hypothetical protein
MARQQNRKGPSDKEFFSLVRELRIQLHDIDQKLEHLIHSHRHFYSLHYKERELND